MSRQHVSAVPLAFCALAALVSGCASLWTKQDAPAPSRGAAAQSLSKQDSVDDSTTDGLPLSYFSWDTIKKQSKRLVGKGENKRLAIKLFREAEDLFNQALAAEAARRPGIFELAAPKY